jgi:hypothetical protein
MAWYRRETWEQGHVQGFVSTDSPFSNYVHVFNQAWLRKAADIVGAREGI